MVLGGAAGGEPRRLPPCGGRAIARSRHLSGAPRLNPAPAQALLAASCSAEGGSCNGETCQAEFTGEWCVAANSRSALRAPLPAPATSRGARAQRRLQHFPTRAGMASSSPPSRRCTARAPTPGTRWPSGARALAAQLAAVQPGVDGAGYSGPCHPVLPLLPLLQVLQRQRGDHGADHEGLVRQGTAGWLDAAPGQHPAPSARALCRRRTWCQPACSAPCPAGCAPAWPFGTPSPATAPTPSARPPRCAAAASCGCWWPGSGQGGRGARE
jgi:hypothetical protein